MDGQLDFPEDLPDALRLVIAELGFTETTPIQAAALPVLLARRDVVGRAPTGSGKTVAFGLPLLADVDVTRRRAQALVLCPTRELTAQVATTLRTLGRRLPGLRVLTVTGGLPRWPQRQSLREGVHVIVGTPGRVLDHLEHEAFDPSTVRTVVLDEADRMLDLGFQEDVERLLGALPVERHTAFFSATFPDTIAAMSQRWQRDPAVVTVDADSASAPEIRQVRVDVEEADKVVRLRSVLSGRPGASVLVFCNLKRTAQSVAEALGRPFAAAALHGDLSQHERDRVLAMLRNRSVRVVVATDVAARGLDVSELDLVVNHDLPDTPDTYVHRIGRTGRAGRLGEAITFVTALQGPRLAAIEAVVGALVREEGAEVAPVGEHGEVGGGTEGSGVADMVTLRIGGGRKDKLRKGDLLGAFVGEAGLKAEEVGVIEIHDTFAYVAVARGVARGALERLRAGTIKGRRFRVDRV